MKKWANFVLNLGFFLTILEEIVVFFGHLKGKISYLITTNGENNFIYHVKKCISYKKNKRK